MDERMERESGEDIFPVGKDFSHVQGWALRILIPNIRFMWGRILVAMPCYQIKTCRYLEWK